MRIALYVPAWPPGAAANGIVTYASHLVPALRAINHEVFVLTPHKTTNDEDPHTIDLKLFGLSPLWQSAMHKLFPEAAQFNVGAEPIAAAVKQLFRKHEIDVLEIEESFGWSFAVSKLDIVPVVVRLHGPWFLTGRSSSRSNYSKSDIRREIREKQGISAAEIVTSPSATMLETVKSHYRLKLASSASIPNPIEAALALHKWNVLDCIKDSLLFVGRFDTLKGGDLVIKAFGELSRSYPALKLTFVGPDVGVEDVDGKRWQFDEYTKRILPESARSRITFTGTLPPEEVAALRTKHFATLCTSKSEIFPYSILEAMAFGCPIVAPAVGGIPDIIQSGRNGTLFQPGDLVGLVSALRTLLDNPTLATHYGDQAWEDCRNLYSSKNVARVTSDTYIRAINQFKARQAGR
jgi:glycosyltransferase involved in cell wall biosynthesis